MAHIILGVSDDSDSSIFKIPQIPILIIKAPYSVVLAYKSFTVKVYATMHCSIT